MAIHRLAAPVLALALASCSGSGGMLSAENEQLRAELEKEKTHTSYIEQQAAVAAGCAWLVPVCPRNITTTGQKAIAAGYGGGSSPVFWLIVIAKAALLAAATGAIVAGGAAMWRWLAIQKLKPEAAEVEAARTLLAGLQKTKNDLEADAARLLHTKQQLINAISEAREAHQKALDELDSTKSQLEATKAAYGALNAFAARPGKKTKPGLAGRA